VKMNLLLRRIETSRGTSGAEGAKENAMWAVGSLRMPSAVLLSSGLMTRLEPKTWPYMRRRSSGESLSRKREVGAAMVASALDANFMLMLDVETIRLVVIVGRYINCASGTRRAVSGLGHRDIRERTCQLVVKESFRSQDLGPVNVDWTSESA
jgi:hypothetical protein